MLVSVNTLISRAKQIWNRHFAWFLAAYIVVAFWAAANSTDADSVVRSFFFTPLIAIIALGLVVFVIVWVVSVIRRLL